MAVLEALIIIPFAYWLPGAALASLVEWRGVGRLARILAPFAISLVVTPVLLVLPSALIPYHPDLFVLGGFTLALFLAGALLRRLGRRPVLEFRPRTKNPGSRRELILGSGLLVLTAVLAVVPRLPLLIYGSQVGSAIISDFYWHLSELTAVARSGLPPQHDFFPGVPLIYYYYSWIYPAVLATLPTAGESLMRLLNLQVAVILLAFLGVLFAFLRNNLNSAGSRWFALIFLTLAGGLDFFTSPSLYSHEWWQNQTSALVSQVQIPAMLTTYVGVPQHVAGAMGFLMLLLLWRNFRGSLPVRGALAVVVAAFILGTSTFVFISAAVAALVWVWQYRRALFNRRALIAAVCLAAFFLLLAGPQIALSFTEEGSVRWGEFRVVIAEAATGTTYARSVIIDQVLTILAFPVVASVILAVEMGLPFVLYAVWLFRGAGKRSGPWHRFLAVYPLAFLPIAFLLASPNFGMRGIIPVLILMVFGAALLVEEIGRRTWTGWQRTVLTYGLAVFLLAQILSTGVEWLVPARKGMAEALRLDRGFFALPLEQNAFPDGDNHLIPAVPALPEALNYIYWANANLPADALVVEIGLPGDYNRLHLLERMCFVDPAEVEAIPNGVRDLTLVNSAQLDAWWSSLGDRTVWEKALHSTYVLDRNVPVYLIVHNGTPGAAGLLVYRDSYVSIYQLRLGGQSAGEVSP
jgi:hypothetical protein